MALQYLVLPIFLSLKAVLYHHQLGLINHRPFREAIIDEVLKELTTRKLLGFDYNDWLFYGDWVRLRLIWIRIITMHLLWILLNSFSSDELPNKFLKLLGTFRLQLLELALGSSHDLWILLRLFWLFLWEHGDTVSKFGFRRYFKMFWKLICTHFIQEFNHSI